MNELFLVLACLWGGVLGVVFFGGLWWTTRRGLSAQTPGLWFLGSLVARTGIALAGFYIVGNGHLGRLLICLLGFVTAQAAVTWLARTKAAAPLDDADWKAIVALAQRALAPFQPTR